MEAWLPFESHIYNLTLILSMLMGLRKFRKNKPVLNTSRKKKLAS